MTGPEYLGSTPAAVQVHYDLGREFFGLWLDASLTYSGALWEDGDDLEQAQERKLDYLLTEAVADGAERLLDVGCGWGSMLRRAVSCYGVREAVGLTLSADQAEAVREDAPPSVTVRLENWADHTPSGPYDAMVSAGAFEHFARWGMRRPERVKAYRRFFTFARSSLRPGGRLALQTILQGNRWADDAAIDDLYAVHEVLPEAMSPRFSELLQASERLFDVVRVRLDPADYARTAAAWLARLEEFEEAAARVSSPAVVQQYRRYLKACVRQFETGHATLVRITLQRV